MSRRALAILSAAIFLGRATTITGPVAGYVAESSGNILRPIVGVPGSYRFGDPMVLPEATGRVHVAPGQDYAVAQSGDGGLAVLRFTGTQVSGVMPVPGVSMAADRVFFSPAAAAAVLIADGAARLVVIGGLPAAPRVVREIDTSSLPEMPRRAAVSEDGRMLVVASRQTLYFLPAGGGAQRLATYREIAALALFRGGRDAAVWDAAGAIHLWQNLGTAAADRVLAAGLKGAGKLYPSWDGSVLFATMPGKRAVLTIDVSSGEIGETDTGEAPTVLDPLRNRDTFLIAAKPHQPGWIFYQDGTAARVVFVVPPPETLP